MADSVDTQVDSALALLPATGEMEFDTYKAQLQAANPDNAKAVFTRILTAKLCNRRLQIVEGVPTVYLSRKVS